jgi:hypothetical protein
MNVPNPGKEWNKKERLALVNALSTQLIDASRHSNHVPAQIVFEAAERIHLIATETAYFLECNRAQVLEGLALSD